MGKILGLVSAPAVVLLLCSGAQALPITTTPGMESGTPDIVRVWDNCGVGLHRTVWGECVSNWAHGPGMRGCPHGYHLGYQVHACVPNHYY
jgi:hypothetical protein